MTSLKKIESQLEWGKENLKSPYDNLDEGDIRWLVKQARNSDYFEMIEDKLFEVRKLLQKYDRKKIKKDDLVGFIKDVVDYRSDY